jgi:hypothetical protein
MDDLKLATMMPISDRGFQIGRFFPAGKGAVFEAGIVGDGFGATFDTFSATSSAPIREGTSPAWASICRRTSGGASL